MLLHGVGETAVGWRWLSGLSHVPISDDPALVGGLMRDFLDAERGRSHGAHLSVAAL